MTPARDASTTGSDSVRIRPMTPDDIATAERICAIAFHELDVRMRLADEPAPELRPPHRAERWRARIAHILTHDAPGCWVAEDADGTLVGEVIATSREGLWGLSNFAVLPGLQAKGVGKRLLEASLGHGDPHGPGIICASDDPRASRRYRQAGFDLHPAMGLTGRVDRSAIPSLARVRAGSREDVPLLEAVDRSVRGASRGPDFEVLLEQFPVLVVDGGASGGRGYVFVEGGSPYLLAATTPQTAADLLWGCLAESDGDEVDFDNLTAEQQWAVDVGLAAGLTLRVHGYVGLRRLAPPSPYIPSPHFL